MIEGPDVSEISVESNATYTMNCIDSFGVASSATSCTAGAGETSDIASGGNYMNSNGNNGTSGKSNSYSMGSSTIMGGAGGKPGYSGGNTGGQGAAIKWNGQTTFTRNITAGIVWDGSAGFIKIYRGNTNTIN